MEECMAKITISVEVEDEQADWLTENSVEYGLSDQSKALRVLLDYAIQDVDAELIFSDDNSRCRFCG
tara:strand:- start:500 stop:700 length:201 start_codon:yes stop_codon:yes gene_type:complete